MASGAQSTVTVAWPFGKMIPNAGYMVNIPSWSRDCPPPPIPVPAPTPPPSCLQVDGVIKIEPASTSGQVGLKHFVSNTDPHSTTNIGNLSSVMESLETLWITPRPEYRQADSHHKADVSTQKYMQLIGYYEAVHT